MNDIQAMKITGIPKEDLSPLGLKVQALAKKWQDKVDISLLDDIALLGPKDAFTFFFEKLYRKVTLANFRSKFGQGIDYFKVGFKSYDFDSAFALQEFAWKVGRINKCLKENNSFIGVEDACAQMDRVEELITRVLADEYYDLFELPITQKYGEREYTFEEINDGSKNSRMLSRRKFQTDKDEKAIRRLELAASKAAHKMREKEWKEAIKIIENNVFAWWD